MIRLSESTCAHSTRRIQWLKYIRISIRPNPRGRECRGLSIGRGLFVAPIFRFLPVRASAYAFLHFPTRSNSPVCTTEWYSHSYGIRHSISNFALAIHAIPCCFSTESNTIFPTPSSYATIPRLSRICRAASRHPFASVIPSANLCATRGFALRKAYSAYSRHLLSGELLAKRSKMQKRIYGGFWKSSFDLVIESIDDILAQKEKNRF